MLCGAGADVNHMVCVLDLKGKIKAGGKSLKGGVLGKTKGGPDPILDCAWADDEHFCTCGPKNFAYWQYSKKSKFKKPRNGIKRGYDRSLLCVIFDKWDKRFLVGTK